jgi:hypothetical protein
VGGRTERVKAILSRYSLSIHQHPEIPAELIIVDGSMTAEYREVCEKAAAYMPLKYISLPIGKFINAGYPRNVGLRCAEGKIVAGIDIDYWIGEHFIYGATRPYKEGRRVLNQGYVIDSSKSNVPGAVQAVEKALLNQVNMGKIILEVYKWAGIPSPRPWDKVWLWAAPYKEWASMRGYDEVYCRQFAYTREDDDNFWRLAAQLPVYNTEHETFCAIHLWHPAAQRNSGVNQLNKDYYKRLGKEKPESVKRNVGWQWGKMLKHSFAIIQGEILTTEDYEDFIADKSDWIEPYADTEWKDIDEFMAALESYIGRNENA